MNNFQEPKDQILGPGQKNQSSMLFAPPETRGRMTTSF